MRGAEGMERCFSCGKAADISGRPGRGEVCLHCGADMKVCLNCAFHDRNSYNECREPSAERVLIKDRSNYCEHFEWKGSGPGAPVDDGLKGLRALFKE